MRPLFIPLKTEFYRAFERGEKTQEYRAWGPRWNEKNLIVGREVILSHGFTRERLNGVIVALLKTDPEYALTLPGWITCYGRKPRPAAVITISLEFLPSKI